MRTKSGVTKNEVLTKLFQASPNDFSIITDKANQYAVFYHHQNENCVKIFYKNHKYIFQIPSLETRREKKQIVFNTRFSIQWFKSKKLPKKRRK